MNEKIGGKKPNRPEGPKLEVVKNTPPSPPDESKEKIDARAMLGALRNNERYAVRKPETSEEHDEDSERPGMPPAKRGEEEE